MIKLFISILLCLGVFGDFSFAQENSGDTCPIGQVMIGGKCRMLGKKPVTQSVTEPQTGEEPSQSSDDTCPTGQVMIGGKCRALGKKPIVQQTKPAEGPSQTSDDACQAGEVMIGGKCRTLGKKPAAQTAAEPQKTDEPTQSSSDSCPAGQVMIGSKCRSLGKKAPAQSESVAEPAEGSTDTSDSACQTGEVMIGGKCRALGKKPIAPLKITPEATDQPMQSETTAGTTDCQEGQVMIGGKCRMLGKKPLKSDQTSVEPNDQTVPTIGKACDPGQVLIGGMCRKLAGKPKSAVAPVDDATQNSNDYNQANEQPQDAPVTVEPGYRAGAWGGAVREGPGREYKQIASLVGGQSVEIIEQTGEVMNEYPWFKIRFGKNQIGYEWGGLLCSYDGPKNGLYQTCSDGGTSVPVVQQQDDGLVWQSKWFNDPQRGGALTSQLILGVPETDAVKFFAVCASGIKRGAPVLTLSADVSTREDGAPATLRFANGDFDAAFKASILRSESGEGLEGYRLSLSTTQPIWEIMSASKFINYGENDSLSNTMKLKNSRQPIMAFLSGCDVISKQAAN